MKVNINSTIINKALATLKIARAISDFLIKWLFHQHHLLRFNKISCLHSIEVNTTW